MNPRPVEEPEHEGVVAECLLGLQERLVFQGKCGSVRVSLGIWFQQTDHAAPKVWVDVEPVKGSSEERRKCMKGSHTGSVIAAEEVMCIFQGAATEGGASS
jgi:hypothetical protein